jgi:hypothetical protein
MTQLRIRAVLSLLAAMTFVMFFNQLALSQTVQHGH